MERRFKIFYISHDELFHWLLVGHAVYRPRYVAMPRLPGVPSDATLHSVNYDWPRGAFGFLVSHASFDIVPDGEPPPNVAPFGFERTLYHLSQPPQDANQPATQPNSAEPQCSESVQSGSETAA